ncbi:MAG: GNAT family N-acetyltransferase [Pseudomonadota bacterium]
MIRSARTSDLHQLRYLAQIAFAPYATGMTGPRAPLSADLRTLVEAEEVSVSVIENAVRGFICYRIDGPDVHIEALAVGARYRRRGVGRQMLDHADRAGLRRGCRRAVFHTNAQMFENIAYFRAKGFQPVDERIEEGFKRVYLERYLT